MPKGCSTEDCKQRLPCTIEVPQDVIECVCWKNCIRDGNRTEENKHRAQLQSMIEDEVEFEQTVQRVTKKAKQLVTAINEKMISNRCDDVKDERVKTLLMNLSKIVHFSKGMSNEKTPEQYKNKPSGCHLYFVIKGAANLDLENLVARWVVLETMLEKRRNKGKDDVRKRRSQKKEAEEAKASEKKKKPAPAKKENVAPAKKSTAPRKKRKGGQESAEVDKEERKKWFAWADEMMPYMARTDMRIH